MAVAYLATERGLDRLVAIKVMKKSQVADETARRRFEREARASASLSHPGIVQVYRYGRLPDDTPFLVMHYVKGRTMEDRVEAEGGLELTSARAILASVASALAAAHAKGIIHRDVRPANVLWDDERQEALLSDFGIAALQTPTGEQVSRLTNMGEVIGSPRYLSPEQIKEEPLTEMVDIYAFGITGYELLTGRGPYDETGPVRLIAAHLHAEPRPLAELRPDAPADLADVLRRCLNKDPRKRPRAADIVRMLESEGAGGALRPTGRGHEQADLQELVRRRVPQIVFVTAGVGWLLLELSSQLVDGGVLPNVFYRLTLPFVVAGVLASTVVSWFHGERGHQRAPLLEYVLLALVAVLWVGASVWIVAAG